MACTVQYVSHSKRPRILIEELHHCFILFQNEIPQLIEFSFVKFVVERRDRIQRLCYLTPVPSYVLHDIMLLNLGKKGLQLWNLAG